MAKKLGYLVFVLIIALTFLGAGYSAWNQTLNVNGTVTPGTLSATIDVETPGLVSSADYATIVEGESTDTNLIVVIDNAAPGNVFTINYRIVNSGTVTASVSFAEPVVTAIGTGATASDISVSAPQDSEIMEGGFSAIGVVTVTVNDSTPMTGGISYTISIGITVSSI